ncbi:MAG: methylenetetrahydrofolate reductase [Aquiluna sp.]|jgi:methylenetetrahydrofolate reductase (NADPH)|nr:methylenetetrahydrofolate reductase [Aquiluna sp.]
MSKVQISFEVYPPRKPEAMGELQEAILKLSSIGAEFISVTFGAGGSETKNSLEVLKFIKENSGSTPLAHLTCVGTTSEQAAAIVEEFRQRGINDFLALRGDLPQSGQLPHGALERADQLVTLIAQSRTSGKIAVAAFPNGHPESHDSRRDIDALLAKQEAGADFAITQLFFYARDYFNFMDLARSRGVRIPVIPGIMPITSSKRLTRVLELTEEKEPSELARALASTDLATSKEAGIDWAANLVSELVAGGVEAVHLYAFNEYRNVTEVLRRAKLVS